MIDPLENPYFGGKTAKDGQVRRLEARTFKDLVDRYIRVPVSLPFTRKEFNSWGENTRNDRKDGGFVCAATFDYPETGRRNDDSSTGILLAILDLDEGEFVKDFFESPETIGEHLYPLNFVAWTTAKHTAKAPRLKIMVDVDRCHPENHRKIVTYLARHRLGLPSSFKGLRESRVISQPQYRPVQFSGDQFSAVIASRTNGIPFSITDLPTDLNEEDVDLRERVFACDRGEDFDHLGLAYLPLQDLEVEDVREALESINADCEYKVWVEIASALRHQFVGEDQARDAYHLFDEWSQQGTKYRGEKDTYCKWKSLRPYAAGRAPVTIRTLYHHATTLGGWQNTKVAAKLKHAALEWINACEDGDELMTEGAKKIAAMPFTNEVVEESLILAWKKRLKELTGNAIEKSVLKKEIHKVQRRERAERESFKKDDDLPDWLQYYCYVATSNVFHDHISGIQLAPGAFDNKYSLQLMPKDGAEIPANGKPLVAPSAYALNLKAINRVDETLYCPLHGGDNPIITFQGRSYLNTFNPNSVPAANPDHSDRAGKLWQQMMKVLIQEEYLQNWLTDFIAHNVQYPGVKIRHTCIIQSAEGAGKGFLASILRGVFGLPNVRTVSSEVLKDRWNDWMTGAQFYVFEEVHIPGDIREKVMNALKTFITDDVITINKRNTSAACGVPNFANCIAFTNYFDALHLKESNRRWAVIQSPVRTKDQVTRLKELGHFEELQWLLTPEGAAGLRYFLQTWRITDKFDANGPAPWTPYVEAVIQNSKNPLLVAIEDILANPVNPGISDKVLNQNELVAVLPFPHNRDVSRITHYLNVLGWSKITSVQDGIRQHLWVAPEADLLGNTPAEYLAKFDELRDLEI